MRKSRKGRHWGYSVGAVTLECLFSLKTLEQWSRNGPAHCRGAGSSRPQKVRAAHGISGPTDASGRQSLPGRQKHIHVEWCRRYRKKRPTLPSVANLTSTLSLDAPHPCPPIADFIYRSQIFMSHLQWLTVCNFFRISEGFSPKIQKGKIISRRI